jgi:hypothetical protein
VRKFRYAPQGHAWPAHHMLLGSIEPGGVYEADDYAAAGLTADPDFTEVPAGDGEPVTGYDELTVDDVVAMLENAEPDEVAAIQAYEAAHKDRVTIREFAPEQAPDDPDAETGDGKE